MRTYLDLLEDVLKNGEERGDRTGVGTISKFGLRAEYDLQEGFPAVTTKKLFFKGVKAELLWFIRGETNVKFLQDNGVHIWDQWIAPYSTSRPIVMINPVELDYVPYQGDFSYLGINASSDSIDNKLANIWVKMMKRCYKSSEHNYDNYGGSGASVCKKWHNPSNFIDDVKILPHWRYKLRDWNGFELDKDYYNANQYGPETCVWLSKAENNFYTSHSKPLKITNSEGKESFHLTLNKASKNLGITTSSLHRFVKNGMPEIVKGNNKNFIGWCFDEAELDGKLMRLELIPDGELGPIYGKQLRNSNGIDQLVVVIDSIKNNPKSRRHVISLWNPGDLPHMALPPCHGIAIQFYVRGEYLDCQMYQRSGDMFLGVPFNIASYSLLTYMIAQVTGYKPGRFIHVLGDGHIYKNHVDQVKEQLSRTPLPLPSLKLNEEIKDIDSFTMDDIELVGYTSHPSIKAPIAV